MTSLKIGQIEFASKDFHRQAPITVLSDKVSSKNGKGWRYIVGYQVDGGTILTLFIKTPRNVGAWQRMRKKGLKKCLPRESKGVSDSLFDISGMSMQKNHMMGLKLYNKDT